MLPVVIGVGLGILTGVLLRRLRDAQVKDKTEELFK